MPNRKAPQVRLNEWLLLNLKIGALSFGGAGRIMLYNEHVVQRKGWMDEDSFREVMTLAQAAPGPNLINISAYTGFRLSGGLAASLGVLALTLPGALLIVFIAAWLNLENPHTQAVFQGFSLASILLFAFFLVRLGKGLVSGYSSARARPVKIALRATLAALVGIASAEGLPLPLILVTGAILGLLLEFSVRIRKK